MQAAERPSVGGQHQGRRRHTRAAARATPGNPAAGRRRAWTTARSRSARWSARPGRRSPAGRAPRRAGTGARDSGRRSRSPASVPCPPRPRRHRPGRARAPASHRTTRDGRRGPSRLSRTSTPCRCRKARTRASRAAGSVRRNSPLERWACSDIQTVAPWRSASHGASPMWSGWSWVTKMRRSGRPSSACCSSSSQAWRQTSWAMPVSTSSQPSPSSISHTLMWLSSMGNGMRSQRTPSAIGCALPNAGGSSGRKSSLCGPGG